MPAGKGYKTMTGKKKVNKGSRGGRR